MPHRYWRTALGSGSCLSQHRIHLRHHLKRIRHVHHVGLAARPSAVWIEAHSAPLADEPPAHHVRLFAMAAGRQSFRDGAASSPFVPLDSDASEMEGQSSLRRPGPPAICCCPAMRPTHAGISKSARPPPPRESVRLAASSSSPAPATNSSFASGRIVCCIGSRRAKSR